MPLVLKDENSDFHEKIYHWTVSGKTYTVHVSDRIVDDADTKPLFQSQHPEIIAKKIAANDFQKRANKMGQTYDAILITSKDLTR